MKIHIGKKVIVVKKRFFILFVILMLVSGALFYLRNSQETGSIHFKTVENGKFTQARPATRDEELQKLKDQYKNKFVVVFFYDGYTSQQEALVNVQILKETLSIIEPFKSLNGGIVYKIFTTDSQKCNVKESGGLRLLVCDKNLISSFKQLGIDHFKLVILSPLEFVSTAQSARGLNSWMTLSTFKGSVTPEEFNRFLGLQFAQNLGKSLGLSSEGDASGSASLAVNPVSHEPNCAKDEELARLWWGGYTSVFSNIGYFKGCNGNPNFVYPEQNTIMSRNPQKESYGRVSEDYLRQVLSCFYIEKEKVDGQVATYSATLSSCHAFKNQYSLFWQE